MKLSEAIRLGEFALPPARGVWFARRLLDGRVCGACAVGRAVYAAGYTPAQVDASRRIESYLRHGCVEFNEEFERISCFVGLTWPWTRNATGYQPLWNNSIVLLISWWYESHRMSMAQLADAVEALESQHDCQSQPAVIETAQPAEEVPCQR